MDKSLNRNEASIGQAVILVRCNRKRYGHDFDGHGGNVDCLSVWRQRRLFAEGAFAHAFAPTQSDYTHNGDRDEQRMFVDRIAGVQHSRR